MFPPNIYYSASLMLASIVCIIVAVVVWQMRRTAAGAIPLILLMAALSWWDFAYALFWADVPGPTPFFWLDITYVGVVTVPTAFLAFTLQFTQHEGWFKRPLAIAMAIEPVLVQLFLWTDPWHGLFFAGKRTYNTAMILDAGPVFWMNVAYSYLLVLTACMLLLHAFWRSADLYRRQAGMVLTAAAIPWLSSIIFVSGLNPFPNADNTPFAFTLAGIAFAYALLRYRLLDVVPIARDVLIENMSDGVIVLDARNRIVDVNPVARGVIASSGRSPIGEPAADILSRWPETVAEFHNVSEVHTEVTVGDAPCRHLDLRITSLFDRRRLFAGRLIVWRDITALKRVQAELQSLATTDPLTQAFNRRHFMEVAQRELRRAVRYRHPLAVVVVDIDHFKRINDTHGHAAGDQVLVAFTQICQKHTRETDLFARFGGEEFTLLMPETSGGQAFRVVERLRRMVAQLPLDIGAHCAPITFSSGVAALLDDQDTLDAMLHRADQALYAAKESGRNRVVLWHDAGLVISSEPEKLFTISPD